MYVRARGTWHLPSIGGGKNTRCRRRPPPLSFFDVRVTRRRHENTCETQRRKREYVRGRDGKCRTSSRASNKSVEHVIPRRTYRGDSAVFSLSLSSAPFLRLSVVSLASSSRGDSRLRDARTQLAMELKLFAPASR